MSEPVVLSEVRGRALWIWINRPQQRNAMTDEVIGLIHANLHRAEADASVRVVVLTGVGDRAFCAGADLKPGGGAFQGDKAGGTAFGRLLRDVRRGGKPLIARVNGHCMAGGMGLLGMCDMAISTDAARFGLPEVKVGVFPMQVYAVLRTLMPPRKFREFALTGEPFDATAAREAGLLNEIVPAAQLDTAIERLIERLADKSLTAQRAGKRAMDAAEDLPFDEALALMEREIVALGQSDDALEGRRAFAEKRAPKWSAS